MGGGGWVVKKWQSRPLTKFCMHNRWATRLLKMQKLTAQSGGGVKKWKSRPLYQTQLEMYGKAKWMATSERVNLFLFISNHMSLCQRKNSKIFKIRTTLVTAPLTEPECEPDSHLNVCFSYYFKFWNVFFVWLRYRTSDQVVEKSKRTAARSVGGR